MKKICSLLLLAAVCLEGFAQTTAAKADEVLSRLTREQRFSGNVLIARDGEVLFRKSYGYADLESKRLNDENTEFRAGSLTKMFTSALLLQYVEQGKIKLDDRLSRFLPQFPDANRISIEQLLSHTSGLRGEIDPSSHDLAQLVGNFRSEGLSFEPGSRFEYNNFNYMVLGYVAEKIGGKPYAELLRKNVLDRAGMTHSGIDSRDRSSRNKALGHTVDAASHSLVRTDSANIDIASAAGALYTTAGDLLKWAQALEQGKVLSRPMLDEALRPRQSGYGLGWMNRSKGTHASVGHTGSIEGFMADFMQFENDGVTVIMLGNLLPPIDGKVSDALAAIAFGMPFEIAESKQAVAVSSEALRRFIGTYELDGQKMVVELKGEALFVLAPMGDTVEIVPLGGSKFFVKGPEIPLEFIEKDGVVQALYIDMRGGQKFLKTS